MSVSPIAHGLFHSAAAMLATPTAQLSGFSLAGADPDRMAKPAAQPAKPLADGTQAVLLALQQHAPQAGALATDLSHLFQPSA